MTAKDDRHICNARGARMAVKYPVEGSRYLPVPQWSRPRRTTISRQKPSYPSQYSIGGLLPQLVVRPPKPFYRTEMHAPTTLDGVGGFHLRH